MACLQHDVTGLDFGREVELLLSEPIEAASEREATAFDQAAGPCSRRVVLFGAGGMGRRTLAGVRRVGIEPLAFADNNQNVHGMTIDGVPILSPLDAAKLYGRNAVFVITIWSSFAKDTMRQRIDQLSALGCERIVPAGLLFWKYPEFFLPFFPMDLPHKVLLDPLNIKKALGLWADRDSHQEFVAQLRFRLLMDFDSMGRPRGLDAYFHTGLFDPSPEEVFVDCGAFDGDSIEDFVRARGSKFREILAFEPDRENLRKLDERLNGLPFDVRERVTVIPFALGAKKGIVSFSAAGSDQSRIGQGSESVQMVTLDESLQSKHPSFIKFDIEGGELAAIMGARRIINDHRPVLAVSVYHEQAHLWQIPNLLASVCTNYSFYLRPHGAEGWDLLCYAIPRERTLQ